MTVQVALIFEKMIEGIGLDMGLFQFIDVGDLSVISSKTFQDCLILVVI